MRPSHRVARSPSPCDLSPPHTPPWGTSGDHSTWMCRADRKGTPHSSCSCHCLYGSDSTLREQQSPPQEGEGRRGARCRGGRDIRQGDMDATRGRLRSCQGACHPCLPCHPLPWDHDHLSLPPTDRSFLGSSNPLLGSQQGAPTTTGWDHGHLPLLEGADGRRPGHPLCCRWRLWQADRAQQQHDVVRQ